MASDDAWQPRIGPPQGDWRQRRRELPDEREQLHLGQGATRVPSYWSSHYAPDALPPPAASKHVWILSACSGRAAAPRPAPPAAAAAAPGGRLGLRRRVGRRLGV